MKNSLVAYFSATGTTKEVAENLAEVTKSDTYEIKPAIPYTDADLNWTNRDSRTSIEMRDKHSRPEIIKDDIKLDKYDTIFLGFPIWWYVAPTIINTFLESHDFSGKTVILFATSGGSGFGGTMEYLKSSVSKSTKLIEGKLLNFDPSIEEIKEWVDSLEVHA